MFLIQQFSPTALIIDDVQFNEEVGAGRELHCGIRPEELIHATSEQNNKNKLSAQLEVIEPLGSETLLICKGEFGEITGKTKYVVGLKWGDLVEFEMDPERIHFFDKITGKRLKRIN